MGISLGEGPLQPLPFLAVSSPDEQSHSQVKRLDATQVMEEERGKDI